VAGGSFDAIVSADLFVNLKPAPDIFLAAAKSLGLQTHEVSFTKTLMVMFYHTIVLSKCEGFFTSIGVKIWIVYT
jgi:hypothetical protein